MHKVQTEVEGLARAPQQSLPLPFSKDNLKFHKDGSNQGKATGHDSSKTIGKLISNMIELETFLGKAALAVIFPPGLKGHFITVLVLRIFLTGK